MTFRKWNFCWNKLTFCFIVKMTFLAECGVCLKPSTLGAEADWSLWVRGQPGLQIEILLQKVKKFILWAWKDGPVVQRRRTKSSAKVLVLRKSYLDDVSLLWNQGICISLEQGSVHLKVLAGNMSFWVFWLLGSLKIIFRYLLQFKKMSPDLDTLLWCHYVSYTGFFCHDKHHGHGQK